MKDKESFAFNVLRQTIKATGFMIGVLFAKWLWSVITGR
jgi:hypothetical protein